MRGVVYHNSLLFDVCARGHFVTSTLCRPVVSATGVFLSRLPWCALRLLVYGRGRRRLERDHGVTVIGVPLYLPRPQSFNGSAKRRRVTLELPWPLWLLLFCITSQLCF